MLKKKIKQKKGFGTILAICLMSVFLPLLLFVCCDVPYYLQQDAKLKELADTIASGTTTVLDEGKLADGLVEIDKGRARAYLLEELALWFNLEEYIFNTEVPGVKIMKIQNGKDSMFDVNPAIIEITSPRQPITDEKTLNATRVEYFIHSGRNTATYEFTTGQKVQVSTPTVGVLIVTRTRGVIFRIPLKMMKIGMTEAYFDPKQNHNSYEQY